MISRTAPFKIIYTRSLFNGFLFSGCELVISMWLDTVEFQNTKEVTED